MKSWFDNLYEKNELNFALVWIIIYCVANSLANYISNAVGIESSAALVINFILVIILFGWIREKGLTKYYGLCRTDVPAGKFLWYIPLIVFMSFNLWFGFVNNYPAVEALCYILSMICVGFLEEVLFRGFLFKALAKDNVKTAIIISSVTFSLGHILNLFNGRGMELTINLIQVVYALACGFLFVVIFYRGGSLIPCIIAHAANNVASVFGNDVGLALEKRLLFVGIIMVIVIAYALILWKILPEKQENA